MSVCTTASARCARKFPDILSRSIHRQGSSAIIAQEGEAGGGMGVEGTRAAAAVERAWEEERAEVGRVTEAACSKNGHLLSNYISLGGSRIIHVEVRKSTMTPPCNY